MTESGLLVPGVIVGMLSSMAVHSGTDNMFAIRMPVYSVVIIGICSLILAASIGLYSYVVNHTRIREGDLFSILVMTNIVSLTAGLGLLIGRILTSVIFIFGAAVEQNGI